MNKLVEKKPPIDKLVFVRFNKHSDNDGWHRFINPENSDEGYWESSNKIKIKSNPEDNWYHERVVEMEDFMTQREEELFRRVEELEKQLSYRETSGNPHRVMLHDVQMILNSPEAVEDMLERAWNYGYFEGKYGGE